MLLTTALTRWLALAALMIILSAGVTQAQKAAGPAEGAIPKIEVSFQMDPSITRTYTGERFVSPPTYTRVQQPGQQLTVPARAVGLDEKGVQTKISPAWKSGNAQVLQVSPTKGHQVELTVIKEGQTDLTITAGGFTKKFSVKAVRQNGTLRVDISQ